MSEIIIEVDIEMDEGDFCPHCYVDDVIIDWEDALCRECGWTGNPSELLTEETLDWLEAIEEWLHG